MKYNERIIKHNIDVPKLVPNGKINLTKIHYDKSVISHHPKSFEYYMIHGIVIDDIRYVVKEFFVRDNSVLAVVTPDENEYYEVVISNANSDEIDKLKKLIDELSKSKANQEIDLNLNYRTLTVGDKSVTLPTDLQQLSLRGNKLSISGGNSVTLPEYDDSSVKSRIEDLENRVDKDNQELSIVDDKLSIKNGNTVTLPKFNQDLNLSGRTLSISGGNSVTLPEDKDTVYDDSKLVKRITDLENKRDEDTIYDDSDVKRRISTLENKTDNFVSGVGVSREGNKVKLTYTFVDGTNKEVEFEDNDTKALAYDDTAIKSRVKALEDKPDNDKQKLTLEGNNLKLTNGGEVNLNKYDTPLTRYTKIPISTDPLGIVGTESVIPLYSLVNEYGVKDGDIIQDIFYDYSDSGKLEFRYWLVNEIIGNSASISYLGQSNIQGYQNLKSDIEVLKNRTRSNGIPSPVHRFHSGDISGRADSNVTRTIAKGSIINDEGLKVGDTVEDYYANKNTVNRGIWKVTQVGEDTITVQGIANRDIDLSKNITYNQNTRQLSIEGGNTITLPSDKQTITKQGNRLILSNGGGEVDIPTATPYNDADIKRRLGVLEGKPDNDKQTLSISNNRLTISNGNSVDLPQPNLSGYVPIEEYNKLKGALETLLGNLKTSGAWQQTGATIFEGKFYNGRNIATGNINVFGGTVDGNSFIRTSNNSTENDLAGGV